MIQESFKNLLSKGLLDEVAIDNTYVPRDDYIMYLVLAPFQGKYDNQISYFDYDSQKDILEVVFYSPLRNKMIREYSNITILDLEIFKKVNEIN